MKGPDALHRLSIDCPPLVGLVLAGGKSMRMGSDKGLIDWHGKPQRYYVADLLATYCDQVYISCRNDQMADIAAAGYVPLEDSRDISGQYGAILSAMDAHVNSGLIVLACDIPLVDDRTIAVLVQQRDATLLATAYKSPDSGLPEPLIAIWEPRAKAMLTKRANEGISCPRKALMLSAPDVCLIDALAPETIMNVNTPEAARQARDLIKVHGHGR